jgi:hypothetical protein
MEQPKAQVLRSSPVHKGKIYLHSHTDKGVADRGTDSEQKVITFRPRKADRYPTRENQTKPVEGETPYCANCVFLLHLDGIPRCEEFKFLLSPRDIKEPIDCDRYTPLNSLKNMKRFQGVARKTMVVDEIVLGALIKQATVFRRCATLSEIQDALQGRMHRTGIHDVLARLEEQGKVVKSRFIFRHPAAKWRKHWVVNGYWPTLLPPENNRSTN